MQTNRSRGLIREPNIFDIIDQITGDFPTLFKSFEDFQAPRQARALQTGGFPYADILVDSDKNYIIKVALAGTPKEQIALTVQNRVIDLQVGEQLDPDTDKEEIAEKAPLAHYLQKGIKSFTFVENSWTIPEKWDIEKIETSFVDGLLVIKIPLKAEEVKQLEKRTLQLT